MSSQLLEVGTGETVGDVGRVSQRSAHRRFVWSSMEVSSVYITPKTKSRNLATSSSSEELSPEGKKLRHSYSPDSKISDDEDQVMAALNLTEGVTKKLDLILERLSKLDSKMEELNKTVKGLQGKVSSLEIDVVSIKDKQKSLDQKFTHVESNSKFVDSNIKELQEMVEERKDEISACRKQILYLEAYSRRENLKFEGIPELPKSSGQQNATSKEDTKEVLANFMENVLGIEDAKDMELQRVHRIGKPKSENGNGSRTIIARFLRFSDRERVFKCGHKLKDTGYKMYEDFPKELHDLRKAQMNKLKKARQEGKRANFSKSEPDKLYIDGKYVKIDTETQWKNEWGGEIILSHGSPNSCGVAILLKKGVDCVIHSKILDSQGRYIILKAEIKD
ncbi:unnamed protein product, partial [Porites evermanni]